MTLSIEWHYAEWHYAVRCYAQCHEYLNVMLSVIMLNVGMLSFIIPSVVIMNVVMLNVVAHHSIQSLLSASVEQQKIQK